MVEPSLSRWSRRACVVGSVLLLTGGVTPLTATASFAGGSGGTTPPDVVVSSLSPGGEAFEEGVTLNADASVVTEFGPAHRLYSWQRSESTGVALEDSDFLREGAPEWVAVEHVDGEVTSVLTVDDDGHLVQLDGWTAEEVDALAALDDQVEVVWSTDLGDNELFALSGDHAQVTPLTADARALVGTDPVGAELFRTEKRAALDAALASEPTGLPEDAVGGVAVGGRPSGSGGAAVLPRLMIAGMLGALVVATAALLVACRPRRSPAGR